MHALNYFRGPGYEVLFPFAYEFGEHAGAPPFYVSGPGYKLSPALLSGWWRHPDGAESTWITPLFHKTTERDGSLRHMHALNYFEGPDWRVLFPFAYRVGKHFGVPPFYFRGPDYRLVLPLGYSVGPKGNRHSGVVPLYFRGPGYEVCTPLLTAWWRHADGSESSWWTPFVHKTVNRRGKLSHMHAFTYFQGRDWKVLFPFAYQFGKHAGAPPFYFRGPNFKISPVSLSGWFKHSDGAESTWITPLFHQTIDREGNMRHAHAFNYLQGPDWKAFAPLWWHWTRDDGSERSIVPGLYWSTRDRHGEVRRSVLPPLFWYRRGTKLDKSLGFQVRPFSFQRAGTDRELNVLWRLFHYRREGDSRRVMVGPLWLSERPRPGRPARFQFLGGLVARDCNYRHGSYRYRVLWLFPVGPRRRFIP